ncbi:AsmA family protein [Paucibacter sp. PLA-PC-4]|uniref:AsmA family protein n=1 Tax=Paucibacter sp. PLA-PC-4 TaxID=2993655 RepID=UPI00224AD663|nr:AsmA family protein [Paucibacter sp. PLA-PC-4]MCX2863537.1 AsmA family protein [Paucibacter sp. PLA-PC-4]
MKLRLTVIGLALCLGGFAIGESLGWPWLAAPLAQTLSQRLGREVRFASATEGEGVLQLRLLGGLRLRADQLLIGGPAWRSQTPTLRAQAVELRLRYFDLWDWRGSGSLRVRSLQARSADLDLWRDPQGRASWAMQTGPQSGEGAALLQFEALRLGGGRIVLNDLPRRLSAVIDFALADRDGRDGGLFATAHGEYLGRPLQAWLDTASPLPWINAGDSAVPLRLQLRAGATALDFEGSLRELLGLQGLAGNYRLAGPSLSAIGDALGLTLPSTAAFRFKGRLAREGQRWQVEVVQARLGRSRLDGSFELKEASAGGRPALSGRLGGESLWLADLGPAIGVPAEPSPRVAGDHRVLPRRQFDLPSLRAMDADVSIDLQRIELGSALADTLAPARARLLLQDGVLSLRDLQAGTSHGRLSGLINLDGRAALALWQTELNWAEVDLAHWLRQTRAPGQPGWITGQMRGRLKLSGQGRSTAEFLASARGRVSATLSQGAISHLAVEAAGVDLAQGLGLLLRGDSALPLHCALADLDVSEGQVVPRALVLDTEDSTLWMEGRLSLASEQLDLRLRVAPKDFSPLSLRTPVQISGSLGDPQWQLQAQPLMRRLVPAVLLGLINPLAAVLPLMDSGNSAADQQMLQACRRLLERARPRL